MSMADLWADARKSPQLAELIESNRRRGDTRMTKTAKGAIEALTMKFLDEYATPAASGLSALRDRERELYEEQNGIGSFDRSGSDRRVPVGIAEERAALRQRVGLAAAVVKEEGAKHARATKAALDNVRLAHMGADLQAAVYLAQTTHPDVLVQQAQQLAASDPVAAATRAAAAKLTGKVRPTVLDAMTRTVEAALDAAVPERAKALEEHTGAMAALTDLHKAANAAQQETADLAGDRHAAAVASIGAKLADRQAQTAAAE